MSKDSRSVDSSMSGSFGGRPSKGYGSGKTPTATVGSGNLVLVAVMSISTTSGNRNKGVDSYVVVDGTEALEKSTPTVVDKGKVSYADVAVKGICDYGISLNGGGLDNDSMVVLAYDYAIDNSGTQWVLIVRGRTVAVCSRASASTSLRQPGIALLAHPVIWSAPS
ncbi:hypothetical protein V6N13_048479 [Hibiscus sabdariffa]